MPDTNRRNDRPDRPVDGGSGGLVERLLTIPHRVVFTTQRRDFMEKVAREITAHTGATTQIRWSGHPVSSGQRADAEIPVMEQLLPIARIMVWRETPFSQEELRVYEYLSESLSFLLSMQAMSAERHLLAELSAELPACQDLQEAAELAVDTIAKHLNAESVALLQNIDPGFRLLANCGDWPAKTDLSELAETVRYSSHAESVADCQFACPVGNRTRYVLLVRFQPGEPGCGVQLLTIEQAAQTLAPHLEARWQTMVLAELLKLNEASADTPTELMYEQILRSAVRLVPGADSGSLCTRASAQDPFSYQAIHGFDANQLLGKLTSEDEARAWYGPDLDGWLHGRPREIRSDETDIRAYGLATTPDLDVVTASYETIKASLTLPVLHNGEVLAMLNLESQASPAAFGRDAIEVMQLFGAPLASLIHRQQLRDVLMHAALNDELTGLANRRAFKEAANRALARHKRTARPLSLLSTDLEGFKQVNDTLGHDMGDQALIRVADTLQANLRDGDLLSRQGGDEFTVLMPDTSAEEANEVAERLREAIATLDFRGMQIRINIGSATAPLDGASMQDLAVIADRRMYLDKQGKSS